MKESLKTGEIDVTDAAPSLPGMDADMDPLSEAQLRSRVVRSIFELQAEAEPWMEDYFTLIGEGWSWRQAVYMIWASQPAEQRDPATQFELATEVLGLTSDRVIREWKAKNPAIEVRIRRLQLSILSKHRVEVLQALANMAKVEDYKAHADRKLFLEMIGDYVPKQSVSVGPLIDEEDIEEASSEELAALAQLPVSEEEDDDGDTA